MQEALTLKAMERIELNMRVFAADGREVGKVGEVRTCCFEVLHSTDTKRTCLTPASISTVDQERVTLICGLHEITQYECPLHLGASD